MWCWFTEHGQTDRHGAVIPLLQKKGFNITAAQLPLTYLTDDIAASHGVARRAC